MAVCSLCYAPVLLAESPSRAVTWILDPSPVEHGTILLLHRRVWDPPLENWTVS